MTHPLQHHEAIAARLDAVTEIAESMGSVGVAQGDGAVYNKWKGGGYVHRGGVGEGGKSTKQGLLASLLLSIGRLPDVQRGITRIFLRTATAAEVSKQFMSPTLNICSRKWLICRRHILRGFTVVVS